MGSGWWGEMKKRSLVALTLSGWHNFFWSSRLCRVFGTQLNGIQKIRMKWTRFCYGYGFSYVHLRVMALFFPYPNLAFAEDAPFMLKLRQKIGRVGLMEDVEGLCLHIVHSTSSTPDPEISHQLTEEELSDLAVSDSRALSSISEAGRSHGFTFGPHAKVIQAKSLPSPRWAHVSAEPSNSEHLCSLLDTSFCRISFLHLRFRLWAPA